MIDLEQWITIFGITLNLLISSHDLMELYQSRASLNISLAVGQRISDIRTMKCCELGANHSPPLLVFPQ